MANAGVTLYTVGTVKRIPGVRTYVAVDGGMSDNLRPMLYGARYEAEIADRFGGGELCTVAGMHCESGDVLVRDVELFDPRPGDVLVTPATGAYGHAMANNYNAVPRRRSSAAGRCPSGGPARDLLGSHRSRCLIRLSPRGGIPDRPAGSRHGGRRRSPRCSRSAAARSRARWGCRPELSGLSARSQGDFDDILERSDLIVELMGGIEPTREYVLRALSAGRHVVSANKQLLSQHGEEVFDAARAGGVQLRFEVRWRAWYRRSG